MLTDGPGVTAIAPESVGAVQIFLNPRYDANSCAALGL
jgi:hypothetical protein